MKYKETYIERERDIHTWYKLGENKNRDFVF